MIIVHLHVAMQGDRSREAQSNRCDSPKANVLDAMSGQTADHLHTGHADELHPSHKVELTASQKDGNRAERGMGRTWGRYVCRVGVDRTGVTMLPEAGT